ncbi:MAG: NUDIX domain-containing protein [Candidatus Bipolaricaulota bacterium]|nr:NUDIX domain-containing protein [Candidatus Bipolaricaulota bacterium]
MKSTSPSEDGKERAAGAVLFREEAGRRLYLLLRHEQGGHWGFAKGRIEKGEGVLEAAMREIREETGISDIELVAGLSVTSRYPIRREGRPLLKTVTYYAARVRGDSIHLSNEHTDGRWVSPDAATQLLTHAESRRVLLTVEDALSRSAGG